MKYIVYCTTNLVNKKIYIGVHQTNSDKFDGYIGCGVYVSKPSTYNHPKTAFQYAVQKYGPKNFQRVTIKEFENSEDAYNLEHDIVTLEFLKRSDVYNQAIGGLGGDVPNNSIPCHQYDLKGNYIASYASQQKASLAVNRGFTTIKRAIKEKIKAADYFWALEKVEKLDISEYKNTSKLIQVFQYSSTGEYDCCYESISDAARVHETSTSNIVRGCKLGYLVNNKYFSYEFNICFSRAKSESLKNKKIYQYSFNGDFIREFNSISEAEKILNKKGLATAIKLGRTFQNYQWSIEHLDSMNPITKVFKARRVGQFDKEGNLVKIFKTVTECKKEFPSCTDVLKGKTKTSKGYIFKYMDQVSDIV